LSDRDAAFCVIAMRRFVRSPSADARSLPREELLDEHPVNLGIAEVEIVVGVSGAADGGEDDAARSDAAETTAGQCA
jgi:hypothetical protein